VRIKKGFVLILAVMLLLTLIFVSNAFSKSAEPATPVNKTKLVGNMYASGLPILKTKKTYTIAVTKDPDSLNSFSQKACVIQTEKLTNVHIEWIDIPYSSWNEQVNVMLASGNMPDAFSGLDIDVMQNIDLFQPLTNDIRKYAPNINEMLTKSPEVKKAVTAPNGRIYCLPTNKDNPSDYVMHALWMNGDWLKKLGKKVPRTTDELLDVLRAFKKGDPNGNGKADEIPLVARTSDVYGAGNIDALFGAFGTIDTPEYVYSKDGKKVLFSGTQPGYYEGLKWLHQLYDEGLLDADVFTQTQAQVNAKATNPDLLIGPIMFWIPDSMDKRFTDYIPLEAPIGPKGDQLWSQYRRPGRYMHGFSITKNCKEPAVLLRYYDTLISNLDMVMLWQWGPEFEGCWERVGTDGKWQQTNKYVPKQGMTMTQFKRTVAGSVFSPMYLWSKWANLEVPDARNAKKRAANEKYLKHAVTTMPYGLYDPKKVNDRNALFVDIDNYMKKFKASSIVNGINDAQWQEHLRRCKQLKTDAYTALWQEYFNSTR
jgi:putative aldouronate transport system substrate-binding protein